ncbi:PfkB family carbohydrate kinase [Actinoplanes teichomyceticus]|uniref:Sugar/nucleoside kinase (Ribokinase family) n=1 Tax=Actinoplanes teichomyceticus TaxID=1867 RepID=A0A561WKZ3_ACTTI|nr:PfkB family carbohydrate kinase [Actinoplanes teichomyceticus]TWG24537.1 sugar/nucleoside kinase (ribokinase family) [Actinoplanes teichomyceticus]GIF16835.1 kinase [Actinoplanes teichomyceticus]
MSRVLLAGLCTLDVLQLVERYPADNEKVTALAQTVAAGGPATNAAATVAHLGGSAVLLTAVGRHPLAAGIHADLAQLGVHLSDLSADDPGAPPVSSIVVSAGTGNRAVVSTNGAARTLTVPDLAPLLAGAAAVQVDGHYPELATAVLTEARRRGIPTVLDAGSWKPVIPQLLPLLDVVVCSADFRPPGVAGGPPVAAYLSAHGVGWIAVSRGAEPLLRWTPGGFVAQPVPRPAVLDTLGAGDILHGALTLAVARRWPLTDAAFAEALDEAAAVASRSCAFFGTRAWMSASPAANPAADPAADPAAGA